MNEGVYLLHLPGDDYAMPVTLRIGGEPPHTFAILVGIDGIKLVSNLPDGYSLTPLVAMTAQRIAAIHVLLDPDFESEADLELAHLTLLALLNEMKP